MKLNQLASITFDSLEAKLPGKLPQYSISRKKNPIGRFEYIEVKKNGFVGVWIRIFKKKEQVFLVNCMPSALVRGLLGGLLFILFTYGSQNKLRHEVGEIIKATFGTDEVR